MNLRNGLFYLIVHGPGYGESVMLRIPPDTWIVVDGCHVNGRSPAEALLTSYSALWSCAVLTHPHRDHVRGLDAVLGLDGTGPVGCADPRVLDPASWSKQDDPEAHLSNGPLEAVMSAILDHWESDPSCRWDMRRHDRKEIGEASLLVLHPDDQTVEDHSGDKNRLSSALLVTWRGVRCLLGGDVTTPDWSGIARSFEPGESGLHGGLKVPHHGARNAIHGCWGDGSPERFWVIAPFNKGKKLPSFQDEEGIAWALTHVDRLHLTGLPVAHRLQGKVPYMTTRQALRDETDPPPKVESSGVLALHLAPTAPDTTDACYVAAGFDEGGTLVDLQHGAGALVVTDSSACRTSSGLLGCPPAPDNRPG